MNDDTLNLNAIAEMIRAAGIPAKVDHSGGGCVTMYVGAERLVPVEGYDDEVRYEALVGPGWFEGHRVVAMTDGEEFSFASDDDRATDGVAFPRGATERQCADAVVAFVFAKRGRV